MEIKERRWIWIYQNSCFFNDFMLSFNKHKSMTTCPFPKRLVSKYIYSSRSARSAVQTKHPENLRIDFSCPKVKDFRVFRCTRAFHKNFIKNVYIFENFVYLSNLFDIFAFSKSRIDARNRFLARF